MIGTSKKIGTLAVEIPQAIPLFEGLGIDYCCGGNRSLEEACELAGVNPEQVIDSLEDLKAGATIEESSKNWNVEPLSEIVSHIVSLHHAYVRSELARLGPLIEKVCTAHGSNHPELFTVRELFVGLSGEMTMHLYKEESILFPYIKQVEAAANGRQPLPRPPFGSFRNPIQMMEEEHESAAEALRAMRKITSNFTVPGDACTSYEALYKGLSDFERDLHLHVHLENNMLFPRCLALESGTWT